MILRSHENMQVGPLTAVSRVQVGLHKYRHAHTTAILLVYLSTRNVDREGEVKFASIDLLCRKTEYLICKNVGCWPFLRFSSKHILPVGPRDRVSVSFPFLPMACCQKKHADKYAPPMIVTSSCPAV